MILQRPPKTSKTPAMDTMRLVTLAMDIPILVAIFAYIGYLIGKNYGSQGELWGILIGGLLGLSAGIISTLKVTEVLRQRELEKEKEEKQQET